MQDDTKQIEEAIAKRTAKNGVFLDLFQNKIYMDSEYFGEGFAVSGAKLSRIFSAYLPRLLQKQKSKNAKA